MKTLLPALSIVLVGLAAPAFASDTATATFDSDLVLSALKDKGVQAVAVAEDWADKLRVTVRLPDGSTQVQYFDANSLTPVAGVQSGSRVLSDLDVVRGTKAVSLDSLAANTNID